MKKNYFLKTQVVVTLASMLMGMSPALAQQIQNGLLGDYDVRIFNMSKATSTLKPDIAIKRDANGKYAVRGNLVNSTKSKLTFTEVKDGQVSINVASGKESVEFTYPNDGRVQNSNCETQMFNDGVDNYLIVFTDKSTPVDRNSRCESIANYYLSPDSKDSSLASSQMEKLVLGEKKTNHVIDNVIEVPLSTVNIHEGSKCSLSPDMATQALHDYLAAQSTLMAGNQSIVSSSEKADVRFDRCFKNVINNGRNLEVVLETSPREEDGKFFDTKGWPQVGQLYTAEMLSKRVPVSCNMKTIKFASLDTPHFRQLLPLSMAGVPLPGVSPLQDDGPNAENDARKKNFKESLIIGLGVFSSRKYVNVPWKEYDASCGNPRAQLEFASKYINDVKSGTSTGRAVGVVTTVGAGLAGGIKLAGAEAAAVAGREASVLAVEEGAARGGAPALTSLAENVGTISANVKAAAVIGATAATDAIILSGAGPKHVVAQKKVITLTLPQDAIKKLNAPLKAAVNPGGGHPKVNNAPVPKVVPAARKPLAPIPKIAQPVIEPKLVIAQNLKMAGPTGVPSFGTSSSNVSVIGGAGSGTGSGGGTGSGVGTGNGSGVLQLNKSVTPPKLLAPIAINYTAAARAAKIGGTLTVRLIVGVDGKAKPGSVRVRKTDLGTFDENGNKTPTSSSLGLDEEAVKAVYAAKFSPAMSMGVATEVPLDIYVTASIPR